MTKIAIISMSGLFPGSTTMEKFWENLLQSKDLTGLATGVDFGVDPQRFFQDEKGIVDKCYSLRGGYIRDFKFDPNGYQLAADYLAAQDKLYQWSLQTAREALAAAGYDHRPDLLKRCGLVLGNLSFPTSTSHAQLAEIYTDTLNESVRKLLDDPEFTIPSTEQRLPNGGILDYTPNELVAEALGLGGTHYALDAACATSLYAIKLAADELITGKTDLMLAGAVCASDQLFIHMGFSIFHAYAPNDGKFVPLDQDSSGLVSSEGAGMVVLKRLADAERDGDQILGVIGGIGLSNDGRGKFLLSPNPKGQRLAFERAYEAANLDPKNTQYLECHATGTPLGDKTELNSIANFFVDHNVQPKLGSVKSNMGHLLTAAGMTGLGKVLLSMQKNKIPPNINLAAGLKSDNGWIGTEQMILETTEWTDKNKQAGINSFGFGGTNAHMIVENYLPENSQTNGQSSIPLVPMAVTGMDVHFGNCVGIENFYQTIFDATQHFTPLPEERWKGFDSNSELLKKYGFASGQPPKGAYIEDFEIDLLRYKIQPQEAETLEPQQALILKVADQAIKDAGLKEGQNVAVLIAMESELGIHQYLARWDAEWQINTALAESGIELEVAQKKELVQAARNAVYERHGSQTPSQHTSFVGNIMASRIAALWDFSGPAFTVSAGEQSAFRALEIAQQLLSLGEVEAVVVGAVDFAGGMENILLRNQQNAFFTGEKPSLVFAENTDGVLPGEGAGALVLQKATTPNPTGNYAEIAGFQSLKKAQGLGYLELTAYHDEHKNKERKNLDVLSAEKRQVAIGSVNTNIGHTFAAAGIAGLIKTILCLHHRFIPGVPNWTMTDRGGISEKVFIPNLSRPWIGENRMAGVSDGKGNCWQLNEAVQKKTSDGTYRNKKIPLLFPLNFSTISEANSALSELETTLSNTDNIREQAVNCYQTFKNKKEKYTLVLLGANKISIQRDLKYFQKNIATAINSGSELKTPTGSYFTGKPLGGDRKVAFVYPGSSTAYAGMGQELFQLFPELHEEFGHLKPTLDTYVQSDYLYPRTIAKNETVPVIQDDAIAMMSSGVFFSAAYNWLLRDTLELTPKMAFGYSMGECSSMWYSNNIWDAGETDTFRNSPIFKNRFAGNLELLAEHWGITTAEAKARWTSLVVLTDKENVIKLLDNYPNVYLTFINTDHEVIISGDKTDCHAIAKQLEAETITLPFQNIIHHDFCRAEEKGLLEMHDFPLKANPGINFYSSITGEKIPMDRKIIAKNSTEVCANAVDFPKMVKKMYAEGAGIFIEVGANATCTRWINTILTDQPHLAVATNQSGKTDARNLAGMMAQLLSHGVELNLEKFYETKQTQEKTRSFYKKITPGGGNVQDHILNEKQRALFKNITKNKKVKKRELVAVGTEGIAFPYDDQPSDFANNKINTMIETTPTNKTGKSKPGTIGENGLKLQDYEAGDSVKGKKIIYSEEDLIEFATGSIAKVFGPAYAEIDKYSRRVMLPMDPYLLVSRVTDLTGNLGVYEPSTMQTEYDIPYNAWFTTDRQIPWAVSVESGQCDLMLISYLGIDLENKGNLVYRLLDCTLTFVDDLPFEGQTLRYDISINSFVKNADNTLFFFSYRCYVEDRLVLKMDGGCAGFFADQQLEEGAGVVYSDKEKAVRLNAVKQHFTPFLTTEKTSFSKADLQALIAGDPVTCFGNESYHPNGRNESLRLPPEKILMLDRIVSVDTKGGAYGLGMIVAEKDLSPDDWYFPCHFRDDEVLAGSLQAEGGGNLLRFYMMMLGLQRITKDARYQPVFDLPQKVRCRKQVTTKDTKLVYKLEIKEIGLIPDPYVIGDLEIISDGVVTVHFENLGLQLREKDNPKYLEKQAGVYVSPRSEGALMNEADITTFALDKLSKCFGDDFKIYDDKTVSRQPNTDLQVISRILSIDGKRMDFSKPIPTVAEYDVPEDAWYYTQNAHNTMPYSILMEVALQPCGLSGAYMGSTLEFPDKELYFRNLDGSGQTFDLPIGTDFRNKVIKNDTVLTSSVSLGGTVLQNYTFELSIDGHVFYKGKSSFGFFPADMLREQVGLDGGKMLDPWYRRTALAEKFYKRINLDSPYGKMKLFTAPVNKPHYRLSDGQLRLLDSLIVAKDQGEFGLGYVHAVRAIKVYDWFFTCHFYQDPVMPGSLGVEAMMQALQTFTIQQGIGADLANPRFIQLPNHETKWKYRGQILQHVDQLELELHIKEVTVTEWGIKVIADGSLWNDEVRIYEVTDLGIGVMR